MHTSFPSQTLHYIVWSHMMDVLNRVFFLIANHFSQADSYTTTCFNQYFLTLQCLLKFFLQIENQLKSNPFNFLHCHSIWAIENLRKMQGCGLGSAYCHNLNISIN